MILTETGIPSIKKDFYQRTLTFRMNNNHRPISLTGVNDAHFVA